MNSRITGGNVAIIGAHLRTNVAAATGSTDAITATAILVQDGVITAIGTDDEIRAAAKTAAAEAAATPIEIIDVNGATVTPGLWDSHAHPISGAISTRGIDLGGLSTIAELRSRLAEAAAELAPGAWLEGWNLEYEMFEETGIDRSTFEDVIGDHPTYIRFYDGHTGLASLSALTAAGIHEPVHYPDGSETVVDENGRFTGELSEMSILSDMAEAIPVVDIEAELDRLEALLLKLAATGVTGSAIMDGTANDKNMLRELESRGDCPSAWCCTNGTRCTTPTQIRIG